MPDALFDFDQAQQGTFRTELSLQKMSSAPDAPMIRLLLIPLLVVKSAAAGTSALDYLNELRQQAGMQPFAQHQQLQQSSQQHADYLAINHEWGHAQLPGRQGFIAAVPMERMLKAGYNNRHGSENVSSHRGSVSPKKSVDGLMSAIYHRLAFLSFDHDQLGIGHASENNFHSYVYNMGNSQKEQLCTAPENFEAPGQYLFKICSLDEKKIRKEVFDQAQNRVRSGNADFVVWPYDKATQISPAFYKEAPDPLPGIDVSGYPVSIQFNPAVFEGQAPRVARFELYRLPDGKKVELAAYFNKNSDINQKFNEFEHAIFPMHRLEWNTGYRAELDYFDVKGHKHQVAWEFRTTDFQIPRYDLRGGETITSNGEPFVVYMKPLSSQDGVAEYTLSYQGFRSVDVAIYDPHTLVVDPKGVSGEATFDFHGRTFRVVK